MAYMVFRSLVRRPFFLVWGSLIIVAACLIAISRTQIVGGELRDMSVLGLSIPQVDPKGHTLWRVVFLLALLFICPELPIQFLDMIERRRAGLILSKPISRTMFVMENMAAVFLYLCLFAAMSVLSVGMALGVLLGEIPSGLIISAFYYPIYVILGFYLLSTLFVLVSDSYSLAITGPILCSFISLLTYHRAAIESSLDIRSILVTSSLEIIYFATPRTHELGMIAFGFLEPELWKLVQIVFSYSLPFLLLLVIVRRKEF